jgi:hypothetical protein
MRCTAIALLILASCIPATAGQNPCVGIYLYTRPAGIAGTNHKPSPLPGQQTSVWVCFNRFGQGALVGGMLGAEWAFAEVGGPTHLSTTNRYAAVGGLTTGVPGVPPGCVMTVGPDPVYPDQNGIIALARIDYWTPAGFARGGTIQIVPYAGVSRVVADANGEPDAWYIHSSAWDGLSGNFGWDDSAIPDGEWPPCFTGVQAATWGSIKALYR